MLKISQQQALERWDALPENLREALISSFNGEIIWHIGERNHLTEEKIEKIAIIAGDVLMGFIPPEDVASEIQETLGVDTRIAQAISNEIRQRIFSPLHEELSKIYNPIIGSPKIEPIPSEKIEPEPTGLPPGSPLQPIEIEAFKPAALPTIADTKTKLPDFEPVMPSESADKSFDKAQDKPFMIHQEAGVQPVTGRNKVSMPAVGWFKKERPKMTESPIKVQLETFGPKIEERKEPITAKTETPKQRIVHYREVENPAPFGKAQGEPFGKSGTQPPKESQPSKIEVPAIKPFDTAQGKSEPLKSSMQGKPFDTAQGGPEQSVKPAEPKVIDLESFFEVTEKKENGIKNEVDLDGNTINLKNNKT